MNRLGINSDVIDKLYKKYGFLDDEGFLIGTNHPNFTAMQNRIDELNRKKTLTPEEEKEGAERVIIQKAYMKELQNYVLDDGDIIEDDESEDMEFDPEEDEEEDRSDNFSYDSHDPSSSSEEK
jgi:hypothetical protein